LCSLFVLTILHLCRETSSPCPTCPNPFSASSAAYASAREQFDMEALKAQHGGDVKMPELLSRLVADCPRQQQKSFSVYDRCRAVYDKSSRYGS
jgi:hypothetical protein